MKKLTVFIVILVAGLVAVGWLMLPTSEARRAGHATGATAGPEDFQPIATVTLPDTLSPDATIGKRAFEAACVTCHGKNATGLEGKGPPLVHKTYEPGHHADMAFHLAVQNGVRAHHWRFGDMPPVEGLTRADVTSIVAYVRELQRENGID